MRWTHSVEGGPRRVNHAAAAVGDLIFSFGGYCTGDNYKDRRTPIDVFVLEASTLRWHAIAGPPQEDNDRDGEDDGDFDEEPEWPYQRYGHTVAAYGNKIYLFGGRNDEAPCNVLFEFDTATYEWRRPRVTGIVPPERDGHSACVIDDHMFVFGGYEETQFRFGLDGE